MKKTSSQKITYLMITILLLNPAFLSSWQAQASTGAPSGEAHSCKTLGSHHHNALHSLARVTDFSDAAHSEQCECCHLACQLQEVVFTLNQDFSRHALDKSVYILAFRFSIITNMGKPERQPPRILSYCNRTLTCSGSACVSEHK